ncbi:MAG: hypothetical protein K8H88_04085 [Sandaracinaceae bacterium]|nr:hypothetical protein [Sandaracinaceae bacterium]
MADGDLDPSALLSPLRAGLKLVRILQRWNEGPDRAALYRDHYEEWVAKLAADLREVLGDLDALAERLDAIEQDRERVLVLGNYGLEAWREAVDRRRAMLGDAALAAVVSELSAAELGRVERTIRALDPEDLDGLAALAPLREGTESLRYERLLEGHLGGAALVASGCVRLIAIGGGFGAGAGTGAEITPLGALVLRFMGRAHG